MHRSNGKILFWLSVLSKISSVTTTKYFITLTFFRNENGVVQEIETREETVESGENEGNINVEEITQTKMAHGSHSKGWSLQFLHIFNLFLTNCTFLTTNSAFLI